MLEPRHPKVFRNLDEAYKTGLEASMKLEFMDDFFLKADIAYVYAKNKDLKESFPLTPPLTTKLDFGFEKKKFWANETFNLVSKQDKIAESFGETHTKGYETLDIRVGIKPIKNITVGFAAINVFDQTYNNHLSFSFNNQSGLGRVAINEPGRNLTTFLQYKF